MYAETDVALRIFRQEVDRWEIAQVISGAPLAGAMAWPAEGNDNFLLGYARLQTLLHFCLGRESGSRERGNGRQKTKSSQNG